MVKTDAYMYTSVLRANIRYKKNIICKIIKNI